MIKSKFISFLFFIFLYFPVFCSSPEDQIKFLNEQLENAIPQQIETLYKYTIQCVEKKEGVYQQVLEYIREKNPEHFKDTREFRIILGGLYGLERLRNLENPTNETIFQFGRIAASLLSPELFDKNYTHELNPTYGIYQRSLVSIHILYALSEEAVSAYEGSKEFDPIEKESLLFDIEKSPQLICKYFRPLIMLDEDAIFHFETLFYALSKGCVLFGLTDAQSSAHGGLFKAPIEVYAHDQAHHNWLLAINEDCEDFTYEYTKDRLVEMAKKFYEALCVDRVFGDISTQKYKRARLAAFYFLHENKIDFISPSFFQSKLKDVFLKLKTKMIPRLETDLNALNTYLKRPEIETHFYTLGFVEQDSDFNIKFGCEHAMLLVDLFPDLKNEIYGQEEQDRTLYYHAQNTLKHLLSSIDWFSEQMIPHL